MGDRLPRRRIELDLLGHRRGQAQELARPGDHLGAMATGEQAGVPDAMEALGQDVDEDPAVDHGLPAGLLILGRRRSLRRSTVHQFTGGARRPVQGRGDRRRGLAIGVIVVEKPGGEADG